MSLAVSPASASAACIARAWPDASGWVMCVPSQLVA